MSEEWRAVVGYEGLYEVSDLGRIRSLGRVIGCGPAPGTRKLPDLVLVQSKTSRGYPSVALCHLGVKKSAAVHVLVLESFVGPRPEWAECARHLDGSRDNNAAANLAWGTIAENYEDARQHGTNMEGERHGRAKLRAEDVLNMRRRNREGESVASLARTYGVSLVTAQRAVSGETWKCLDRRAA